MWQDSVFLIGGFLGAAIMLPTLIDSEASVPRWSSGFTTGLLGTYSFAFYSLDMSLAAVGSVMTAVVWMGIFLIRAK